MAQPVYSTSFIEDFLDVSHTGSSYTVPSGFKAVLRDIDAVHGRNNSPGVSSLTCSGSIAAFWFRVVPADYDGTVTFRGRQVFSPGDIITISIFLASSTDSWSVKASGYLLTLP